MEPDPHDGPTQPGIEALEARRAAVSALLLDLGTAMHGAALPSPIIERRLQDIARTMGVQAEVFVLQGFLAIETKDGAGLSAGSVARADLRRVSFDTHWNLKRVHELTALCGSLARGERSLTSARTELERIKDLPRLYPKWLIVLAYAVYGAAVAARVGGGGLEALAGGIVGLVAGIVHFEALLHGKVDLQKSFLAALVGGLTTFALTIMLPPFDTGRALFGGMTLLVPAMAIAIATTELANDALESGVARLAFGLLRSLMLAFGIALALWLCPLMAPVGPRVISSPLPLPVALLFVAAGGAALTACLQGRKQDVPWIAGAALLAFGTQELTRLLFGGHGSPLLTALAVGLAAQIYGRITGKVPATIVIAGLLQLVPGFLGTQPVLDLLAGGHELAPGPTQARFFIVFTTALQLVIGLFLAELLAGRGARAKLEGLSAAAP
jgi:uncharacterized membrane protein YjjP (DUF1212 family)